MNRSVSILLLLGAGWILASTPTFAQARSRGDDFVIDGDQTGTRLTRAEALRIALEHNLDLVSARMDPQSSQQDILLQEAGYDVNIQSEYRRQESKLAQQQIQDPSERDTDTWDVFGMQQSLKFGASYNVGLQMQRQVLGGAEAFILSDEFFSTGLGLTFDLPLLKGFGKKTATQELVLARNDFEISQYSLEATAEQTMETVENAYWDVVAAREQVRISLLSLRRAEDLLELNRKKVEVGTLAPIDITQAEAGVAAERENVIVAEIAMEDAEDELRRLLAIPHDDPLWETRIVPTDRPAFAASPIDVDDAMATAMEFRPELLSSRQALASSDLNEQVAKKNTRHTLDWRATYTPSGTSPVQDPDVPPDQRDTTGSLGEAIESMVKSDQFTWSSQITYRVPIRNRAAKAAYAKALIARRKAQTDLRNQEQTVRVEVRRAARGVTSGIKRVEAARASVTLQRAKLDAEQKKFDNGMSTSFEVLSFQRDLAQSELSLVRAGLDYAKALAGLERAKGTLLESRGLSIAEQ